VVGQLAVDDGSKNDFEQMMELNRLLGPALLVETVYGVEYQKNKHYDLLLRVDE